MGGEVALFPGLVLRQPCIIVNANGGGLGTRLVVRDTYSNLSFELCDCNDMHFLCGCDF